MILRDNRRLHAAHCAQCAAFAQHTMARARVFPLPHSHRCATVLPTCQLNHSLPRSLLGLVAGPWRVHVHAMVAVAIWRRDEAFALAMGALGRGVAWEQLDGTTKRFMLLELW